MRRSIEMMLTALTVSLLPAVSCQKEDTPKHKEYDYDNVMIYYACGQNDLSRSIKEDIVEMTESEDAYVPSKNDRNVLVACAHCCKQSYRYNESGPTDIIWIYRDPYSGAVVRDTLATRQYTTITDTAAMREILGDIKAKFKSERYGIVFSSHGTGWMPQGSYEEEAPEEPYVWLSSRQKVERQPFTSFGQERVGAVDYFMDIPDMAKSFPMKMSYVIMDACLMGCVEVAYELSEVTDIIGFSQAEVMINGFCYKTITRRLLLENDPVSVIRDTYEYYEKNYSTSVVSCVDCRKMETLAACCRDLVDKYRDSIAELEATDVQRFYTEDHPWFFDLLDIFIQSGINTDELNAINAALDECVLYAAHTKYILNTVPVHTNCGFSMFLPQFGTERLNEFYRTLAWNRATGLVE